MKYFDIRCFISVESKYITLNQSTSPAIWIID